MYANVEVMLVLMLVVVAVFLAGRLGYMDDAFCKKLSSLIVDITCPALILSSTMGEQMPDSQYILPLLLVCVKRTKPTHKTVVPPPIQGV